MERADHVIATVPTSHYTIDFIDDGLGNVKISCSPHSSTDPLTKRVHWLLPHTDLPISSKDLVLLLRAQGYVPSVGKRKVKWLPPGNEPKVKKLRDATLSEELEQKIVEDCLGGRKRSPSLGSSCRTDHDLLLSQIGRLYREAATCTQRKACLSYLLHYQHYNADFTIHDCDRFGYPHPVVAPQALPGYFRTEHHRSYELAEPWIKSEVLPAFKATFFGETVREPAEFFGFGTSFTEHALRAFFYSRVHIDSLYSFCQSWDGSKDTSKRVLVVEIDQADLSKPAHTIVNEQLGGVCRELGLRKAVSIGKVRNQLSNVTFLFMLKGEGDCRLIWGAMWKSRKKANQLKPWKISGKEMFGSKAFTTLHESGAVHDRLTLNDYLTDKLKDEEDYGVALASLGIDGEISITPHELIDWQGLIEKLKRLELEDQSSDFYRRAILRWHECFFCRYELVEFASPLLSSQVAPWMTEDSGLVQWAKAYQNLCEIVMFCLQAFPERFGEINLTEQLSSILDPDRKLADSCFSMGLLPYAMTTAFHVFQHLFEQRGSLRVACLSQNYHETLFSMERMVVEGRLTSQKVNRLSDIDETPDVLIADIHPNNAARERLFQNDVSGWVSEQLSHDPSTTMVLILDVTLNHLADKDLRTTLITLAPFIKDGRLEVYLFQSLAKLIQLGADNFSGGLCLYLGASEREPPSFPPPIPAKEAFLALLTTELEDLTVDYIGRVRANAEWMYQSLLNAFSGLIGWNGYCPARVTQNTDDSTVYVALTLQPLLARLKWEASKAEKLTSDFVKLVLEVAEIRGLPMTGRQSFGFPLSNLAPTSGSTARFAVGIEEREVLEQYVDLFFDILFALNAWAGSAGKGASFDAFAEEMIVISDIVAGRKAYTSRPVKLVDAFAPDNWGHLEYDIVGSATLHVFNKELIIRTVSSESRGAEVKIFHEQNIGVHEVDSWEGDEAVFRYQPVYWTPSKVVRLLFFLRNPTVRKSHQLDVVDYFDSVYQDVCGFVLGANDILDPLSPFEEPYLEGCFTDDSIEDSRTVSELVDQDDVEEEGFSSDSSFEEGVFVEEPVSVDDSEKRDDWYSDFGVSQGHADSIIDDSSGICVQFGVRHLQLTLPDGTQFGSDQIRIHTKQSGRLPVKLSTLTQDTKSIFRRCATHRLHVTPQTDGTVLLSFGARKEYLNYQEEVWHRYFYGAIRGVVNTLQSGDGTYLDAFWTGGHAAVELFLKRRFVRGLSKSNCQALLALSENRDLAAMNENIRDLVYAENIDFPYARVSCLCLMRGLNTVRKISEEVCDSLYRPMTIGGTAEVLSFLDNLDIDRLPLTHDYSPQRGGDALGCLGFGLTQVGRWIVYHLDDDVANALRDMKVPYFQSSLFTGMLDELRSGVEKPDLTDRPSIKPRRRANTTYLDLLTKYSSGLDEKQANFVNAKFVELKIWKIVSPHLPKQLILGLQQSMNKTGEGTECLSSSQCIHLWALFPLIQRHFRCPSSLFDMEHSIPLHELASRAFRLPALCEYVNFHLEGRLSDHLEEQIDIIRSQLNPASVALDQELSSDEAIEDGKRLLGQCLEFFVRYPSEGVRHAVLNAVSRMPEIVKWRWLEQSQLEPPTYSSSRAAFLDRPSSLLSFRSDDRHRIQEFFRITGCRGIVGNHAFPLSMALSWALITYDDSIVDEMIHSASGIDSPLMAYVVKACSGDVSADDLPIRPHLSQQLKLIGSSLIYHLNPILQEKLSGFDNGYFCPRALFTGMFERLCRDSVSDHLLDESVAERVRKYFVSTDAKSFVDLGYPASKRHYIMRWINELDEVISSNGSLSDNQCRYLSLLFPFIQQAFPGPELLYEVNDYVPLGRIAYETGERFPDLQTFISALEKELLAALEEKVSQLKSEERESDEPDDEVVQLTKGCLVLYISYPEKESFLQSILDPLKDLIEGELADWMIKYPFSFMHPSGKRIGARWDAMELKSEDQPRIRAFFEMTGLKGFLMESLNTLPLDKALEWAVITGFKQAAKVTIARWKAVSRDSYSRYKRRSLRDLIDLLD